MYDSVCPPPVNLSEFKSMSPCVDVTLEYLIACFDISHSRELGLGIKGEFNKVNIFHITCLI